MTIPDSQYKKMLEKILMVSKLLVYKSRYEAVKKLVEEDKPINKDTLATIEVLMPE